MPFLSFFNLAFSAHPGLFLPSILPDTYRCGRAGPAIGSLSEKTFWKTRAMDPGAFLGFKERGGLAPRGVACLRAAIFFFKAHLGPRISIVSDSSIDWFNQKECDFYGVSLVPKLTHARKRLVFNQNSFNGCRYFGSSLNISFHM